jgi:hypothetical protein
MIIRRDCRIAAFSILAAITLSLASSAEAAGRARNQDHRFGGQAIPGGPSIRWPGHSFNPTGTTARPLNQDHRPGANVPPVVGKGGTPVPRGSQQGCHRTRSCG